MELIKKQNDGKKDTFFFNSLHLIRNCDEIRFCKDMTQDGMLREYLTDLGKKYSSFNIKLETCEKPHRAELYQMGEEMCRLIKPMKVKITRYDLDLWWGPNAELHLQIPLLEVKYFCIYDLPVPPIPKGYIHEDIHDLGISTDFLNR